MNQKVKKTIGIILLGVGGIYFINALFIGESTSWQDAVITRLMYLGVGFSFIASAYYFCFRTKA